MLLTIFTPTYNRGYLLQRLYESLCQQKVQNFEWVIVDDGSSDDTQNIVEEFQKHGNIPMHYHKQANAGKHIAINQGALIAEGKLFFIVDSDDYLTEDATAIIADKYKLIENNESYAGLSGRIGYSKTQYIGSQNTYEDIHANALDFRFRMKIQGDMAEIIRTDILREYPFPSIDGERFCTEGVLWYNVALKYKFLWFSDIIYIAEYLEGGLTYNNFKIRKNSPEYTLLFYSDFSRMPIPLLQKIKANINYWRFARFSKRTFLNKWKEVNPLLSLIGFPVSLYFFIKES
ncbi:glycosyltransferase family 2 protein [Chryseobacterium carnipullorum]|uniref:Chondroitin polymerase n=1 Tax=Chryseobacterium carnipullorum TaxID=1124835 RepID=A0A376DR48_CHRCU|nr:glycosyltransferase family A protein [Chryseobacterium carnipullorum]AZA48832.1 glycosyltransferase family 2 protein [Chryseobacterium carnipullorum]AZA63741.1 glycosyltransferase family 2 protein [Chryseobacterium carnipullorum]STC93314.1 Chondroitin polymerase [Chryseobacterium carnipullorum]